MSIEENKYYIPDISEFYVGFEYEYLGNNTNTEWEHIICSIEDILIMQDDLEHEHDGEFNKLYRVKYLDKEDLKTLGFTEIEEVGNILKARIYINTKDYEELHYNIRVDSDMNCIIFNNRNSNVFIGVIKNKSELKKLLKQLEI